MDDFLPSGIAHLAKVALWLVGVMVFVIGLDGLRRRRNGDAPFTAASIQKVVEDHGFFLFIMVVILTFGTDADSAGQLAILPFIALFLGLTFWLSLRRLGALQKSALNNPDSPVGYVASPLRLSAEEKRVTFKISALSIGIAVLVAGFVSWLAFSGPKLEAGGLIAMIVVSTLILALLGLGIAGRWPGRMRTAASVEIAATPRQVFDTLRYAENEPYYRGIVRLVERLPEAGEVFRLHYFNTDACSECGLPKHPDSSGAVSRVEILEANAPSFYRLRAFPKGAGTTGASLMDYEEETFSIEAHGSGCIVSAESVAVRPAMWLALVLKIGDPVGEQLRHLKAHLEGKAGGTLYDAGNERIAEARKAPKFCGCEKARD